MQSLPILASVRPENPAFNPGKSRSDGYNFYGSNSRHISAAQAAAGGTLDRNAFLAARFTQKQRRADGYG
jgi:hypothetical protein